MPEISAKTLVLAVQAVESEIRRLQRLPEDEITPGDQELMVQYETAAEELEDAYAEAAKSVTNLPPYGLLVGRKD